MRSLPGFEYLAGLLFSAAAYGLARSVEPLLEPNLTAPFIAAVALASWLGGLGPGLVAVGASTAGFLLVGFRVEAGHEVARMAAFLAVTLLTTWLIHLIRRSREEVSQSEKRYKWLAGELERSNAELEQFAYVASHDLQEPLRMVASYTELLGDTYQGKLGPDADKYIGYAVDGARRMQALINDMLQYSRVSRTGEPLTEVSSEATFDRAVANLKAAIQESGAAMSRGPLPNVQGDFLQLTQLFQNLLGNAIKFRDQNPPLIEVRAERAGGDWQFSIRDNGIGFDPRYADKIFLLFQRLHGREKYRGTGIGLAICKKIVERHGGRIWAESEPGKGSTFFFTIPN